MAIATAPARVEAPMSALCDMMFSLKMFSKPFPDLFLSGRENHDELSHHLEIKRTLSSITWP
jgi:hypothetical protein